MKGLRKLRLFYIFLVSFVFYGSANLVTQDEFCLYKTNSKICKLASLTTKPSYLLLDAIKQSRRLIRDNSTSGLIIKDIETKIKTYENRSLKNGFNFNYEKGTRENAGFLLLSAPDPKKDGYPLIELWDMNLQERINKYNINLNEIYKKANLKEKQNQRLGYPLLLEDGSIIIKNIGKSSAIVKIDKCGKYVTSNKKLKTHHSLEIDKLGYIYVPILLGRADIKQDKDLHPENFFFDGFAILDKNLDIIKTYSLLQIYAKNNLLGDIYGNQSLINDPFHLNDVQPYITSNGNKYALLSMKGHSRVMALDLETLDILWYIDRATMLQHDVDIIGESSNTIDISIFDNNTRKYVPYKNFGNRIAILRNLPITKDTRMFNIGDKSQYEKYKLEYLEFKSLKENERPKTKNEGLAENIPNNNSIMIEETNFGRLIEIEKSTNKILWEYYNKSDNKNPFMMSTSRRLSKLPEQLTKDSFNSCISKKEVTKQP